MRPSIINIPNPNVISVKHPAANTGSTSTLPINDTTKCIIITANGTRSIADIVVISTVVNINAANEIDNILIQYDLINFIIVLPHLML